jgi:hypothetical protein
VSIFQSVAPTQLPVSLDEVKSRLKIYNGEQDDDIVRALRLNTAKNTNGRSSARRRS